MSLVPTDRPLADFEILTYWRQARRLYRSAGLRRALALALVDDLEAAGVTEEDIDRVVRDLGHLPPPAFGGDEPADLVPAKEVWARARTVDAKGNAGPWSEPSLVAGPVNVPGPANPPERTPVDDLPGNGRTGALKGPYYLRGNEYESQDKVAKVIGISQGKLSELLNKGLSPDAILTGVESGEIPKKRAYRKKPGSRLKGGFKL